MRRAAVGIDGGAARGRAAAIAAALGLLAGLLGAGAVGAPPARAAAWSSGFVDDGGVEGTFFGADCPSPSLCVAVGSNGIVASSTDPAGGPAAWTAVHPFGKLEFPPQPGVKMRYEGDQIRAVSCPSPSLCVAAGPQGRFLSSTDPAGGAWKVAERGIEATHLFGLSCPATSLCVAVGYGGRIVTSTDPTGDAAAWQVSSLAGGYDLRAVSCPSTSLCVATGLGGEVLASTDPAAGAPGWRALGRPLGESPLLAVECPSTSLCLSGDAGSILASTDPASDLAAWRSFAGGSGLPITALSCPAPSACAAFDDNADAIVSTDPTAGPAAWSFENVVPAPPAPTGEPNGIFALACPSTSLCVAAGQSYRVLASTDPFDPGPPGAAGEAGRGGGRGARGPGRRHRLRARIVWHPRKRVDPRRHGARVAFRFRAEGARAARFRCVLRRVGRRRSHRRRTGARRGHGFAHTRRGGARRRSLCRFPRRYRLGRGRYLFRVVPIAPGGRRGRGDSYRFRVGPPTERAPTGSCPTHPSPAEPRRPCITPR